MIINDLSHHLPVFCTYDCQTMNEEKTSQRPMYVRKRTDEAICRFRNDLDEQDWREVYVGEVNAAYEAFVEKYLSLYDKHCPNVQRKQKDNYGKNPWITRGLQNACKKKKKLYRDFIKSRTREAEKKYKLYKNRLTTIMRQARKDYYSNLLEKSKTDIKRTWNILNKVMGKNTSGQSNTPSHFLNEDNKKIENINEVVNEFNSFFVNVGPKLAETIEKHHVGSVQSERTRGSRVLHSMGLIY